MAEKVYFLFFIFFSSDAQSFYLAEAWKWLRLNAANGSAARLLFLATALPHSAWIG